MSTKSRRTRSTLETLKALPGAIAVWPKRRISQILLVVTFTFFAYSIGTYFGVPVLVRHLAEVQGPLALHRSIQTGRIKFNPYTLRLSIRNLNVGERGSLSRFIHVRRVALRLSWTSLPRLALVVKRLSVEEPLVRVERLSGSTFNFSDLIAGGAAGTSHFSFAVSNLLVEKGVVIFTDRVLKEEHRVDNIRLAIPFIANLPTDADTYVQPRVQMTVDGAPFSLIGRTKPFQGSFESSLSLSFNHLDVSEFIGYVDDKLPFKVKQGDLTAALSIDFIRLADRPRLQMAGNLILENVAVKDRRGAPLLELQQLKASISKFDPLGENLEISSIKIEAPSSHLEIGRDGKSNLTPLLAYRSTALASGSHSQGASAATAPSAATAEPPAPTTLLNPFAATAGPTSKETPSTSGSNVKASASLNPAFRLSLASLELEDGTLEVTPAWDPSRKVHTVSGIHLRLNNLGIGGGTPCSYSFSAELKSGGRLSANGNVDLPSFQVTGEFTIADLELPALESLAPFDTPAALKSGQLSGRGSFRASIGNGFNLHAEQAQIALAAVELVEGGQGQPLIGWKRLTANLKMFDLVSHQLAIRDLRIDAMHLNAFRDARGNLNLTALIKAPTAIGTETQPAAQSSPPHWQFQVESLAIENANASIEDYTYQEPFTLRVTPLNLSIEHLTSDLNKLFPIEVDGGIGRRGTFKITGEAAINPFQARLRVTSERLPLAGCDSLIARTLAPAQINAKVTRGVVSIRAQVLAQIRDGKLDASGQGNIRLSQVSISDKLTNTSFLRWDELEINGLETRFGRALPLLRIDEIRLNDFYAALILNVDGRLNLANILSSPGHPAVPLTRPTITAHPHGSVKKIPANIAIGNIEFHNGQVNFTDYFIKPNYSVFLTQLDGSVSSFATDSTQPAQVLVTGRINRTSPVRVSGAINPLAPMASVDIEGDAQRIQLPPLTPYSAKYTGYPITGGTLTANVHYMLANQHLTATNHLVLEQLTFGERVESSSASNLPIRLAIAVLKDPQGRIDLRIPVSGSLSDPQFDLGRVIWHGLENVIVKAAAAPFTILARAMGGEKQDLSYIEFEPGRSDLSEGSMNKLEKLTSILARRPALKMRISGRVDPRVDTEGLREAILDDEIKREKARSKHLPRSASIENVSLTPDEYDRYLWRVYKAADFVKPRDLVGLVKRLPPSEMKKMLLAHIRVSSLDLRNLAEKRAQAVYEAMSKKIDRSRLLLGPPKLDAAGIAEGPTTRVDFSLE